MGQAKIDLIRFEDANSYRKYTWVGNRISESDMAKLYSLKQKTRTPITRLVSQAVSEFLKKEFKDERD